MNGDDLEAGTSAHSAESVSDDRAQRFYDRMRSSIERYLDDKSGAAAKVAEFLLLVPDVFILLWRLVNDGRVSGKNKVLLGSGVVYFIFPFDLIPEALVGPLGYLDDLVFAAYVLNRMLVDTDPEILREHWSGSEDVLATIQRILGAADNLIGSKVMGRLKKMAK